MWPGNSKFKRKDEEIEKVVQLYSDGMFRLARNHCTKDQAQDIVQEALLRFVCTDKEFNNPEHMKAWLYRVVLNLCTDYHRQWWQKMRSDYPESESAASNDKEDDEILSLIHSLPAKEATAIYLHYYEEASAEQISQIMKCRPGTVYSLLSRGRSHLKNKLENKQ